MLEQKCKKHWITFTNTYAGTVVLEQSEQFEIFSDIPTYGYAYAYAMGMAMPWLWQSQSRQNDVHATTSSTRQDCRPAEKKITQTKFCSMVKTC